jgi:hypothetical protein
VATSSAVPSRKIDLADGSDRASSSHFAKKLSDFIEINPYSDLLSQVILKKNSQLFSK